MNEKREKTQEEKTLEDVFFQQQIQEMQFLAGTTKVLPTTADVKEKFSFLKSLKKKLAEQD
jgi:hypothetical protein